MKKMGDEKSTINFQHNILFVSLVSIGLYSCTVFAPNLALSHAVHTEKQKCKNVWLQELFYVLKNHNVRTFISPRDHSCQNLINDNKLRLGRSLFDNSET